MGAQGSPGNGHGRGVEVATRSTLVVTNLIKLAGLVLAVREVLGTRDPIVMVFCAVMMSGAQGLETVAITFFRRFFGMDE